MTAPATPDDTRILLVDDDPNWTELLAMVLQAAGYAVIAACSADQAVAAAAARRPALAILDVRMPGVAGIELGSVLREEFDVAFMIMSADDDEGSVREAISAGAVAYLRKSGDVGQCLPTIRTALARAATLRRQRESGERPPRSG